MNNKLGGKSTGVGFAFNNVNDKGTIKRVREYKKIPAMFLLHPHVFALVEFGKYSTVVFERFSRISAKSDILQVCGYGPIIDP